MRKFPSINQFRHAVRRVADNSYFHNVIPPKIMYRGMVKLHGTNAGITQKDGVINYQSRNRTLKVGDDNAGFVCELSKVEEDVAALFEQLRDRLGVADDVRITIFGEWCGEGIQKGVAITQLPKMFAIFALCVGEVWRDISLLPNNLPAPLFNMVNIPAFKLEIDFDKPASFQNKMVTITEQVEAECPVGKFFGVEGVGEDVVWSPIITHGKITDTLEASSDLWFKVKGEKHSVTKVHKLAAVDVERFEQRDELVKAVTTPQSSRTSSGRPCERKWAGLGDEEYWHLLAMGLQRHHQGRSRHHRSVRLHPERIGQEHFGHCETVLY